VHMQGVHAQKRVHTDNCVSWRNQHAMPAPG
jgi:hypothetical protein